MKKLLILMSVILTISCSKNNDPVFVPEKSMAATQLHHYYDEKNNLVNTDTMYHRCKVSGTLLKSYQDAPVVERYCDRNETLEWKFNDHCGHTNPIQ